LLGDFVEAEARALRERDVGDPMKGRPLAPRSDVIRPSFS
jgi:hypothetical protein